MNQDDGPTQLCSNCDKQIAESKFDLHEAYCARKVIRCPKCNTPVDKSEMQDHENAVHKEMPCKHCKSKFENSSLKKHESECIQRPIKCRYCECDVTVEEFDHHEDLCGSRTKKCPYCDQNVIFKEYDNHEILCQIPDYAKSSAPTTQLKKVKTFDTEESTLQSNKSEKIPNKSDIRRLIDNNKFKRTQTRISDDEPSPAREPADFKTFNKKNQNSSEPPQAQQKKRLVKKSEIEESKAREARKPTLQKKGSEVYYGDLEDIESEEDFDPLADEDDDIEDVDDFYAIKGERKIQTRNRTQNKKPKKYAETPVAPPGRSRNAPDDYIPVGEDDDEEFQKAIMESYYQSLGVDNKVEDKQKKKSEPVEIPEEEDEDEEFRRAIEASLEQTDPKKKKQASEEEFYSDSHSKKFGKKR